MRAGTTLVEISIVVAILGIAATVTVPRFTSYRDRIAVRAGAASVAGLFAVARHAAIRRATVTAIRIDTTRGILVLFAGPDTLEQRPLGVVHGVGLQTSRDSVAYAPNGMGYGAANTQIIVRRNAAAETVTVSRLGRVRH
jgi:prepilin-type N-terminal cleavage/methylation domain-containing protein